MRPRLSKNLLLAVLLACSIPVAISASISPAKVLSSILAAGQAQSSVHYVSSTQAGNVRLSQIGDVGDSLGSQRITFRKGAKVGRVTVLVSARTAYIRGDAFTLVNFMGLKAAPAARYAGVWILIPRTDGFYSTVAEAVTLPSTINALRLSRPLSMLPQTTIHGQRVVGVAGKPSSSSPSSAIAMLFARAAGSPLPVKQFSAQGATQSTVVFSNWNEPVHVTVPATALPISTTGLE